jgi:hypothetical protein
MASITNIIVTLAFDLFFLIMIAVGFIRIKKPESGWLLITGFIGLAVFAIPTMSCWFGIGELIKTGTISFDSQAKVFDLMSTLIGMLIPSLILFILFIIGLLYRSHPYSRGFILSGSVGATIAYVILGFTLSSWIYAPVTGLEAEVKSNTHSIQIALERYTFEHNGLYPENAETLIDGNLMTVFPRNPFTNRPQINVPYGSPDFEGNFTYLPFTIDSELRGYYLIGYGYRKNPGNHEIDPNVEDHVIIVLESYIHPDNTGSYPAVPSIQDVIRQSQSND